MPCAAPVCPTPWGSCTPSLQHHCESRPHN
jgi:hypothetical protein